MEDLLFCIDLYDHVEGDSTKSSDKTLQVWKKINKKIVGLIRQWINDNIFYHVAIKTNAYCLWKKLESLYEQKTAQSKAFIIQDLVNIKYREKNLVANDLSRF